jgi:hypothetical protein
MQMPQIVMLQAFSEQGDKAVLPDALMRGKIFSEKFSSHKKSVRKYRRGANINRAVSERTAIESPLRLYIKENCYRNVKWVFVFCCLFLFPVQYGSVFSRLDIV